MYRVLLVEDNHNNTRLLDQLFEDIQEDIQKEINLIKVESGAVALEEARKYKFHLVIMDISLPDMNGITITEKLKELADFKDVPFIAATAHAMDYDEELFRKTFDDYISKPIDDDLFTEKVKKWLGDI